MKVGCQPTLLIDCRMIKMSGIGTYIKSILTGLVDRNLFKIICLGYHDFPSEKYPSITLISMKASIFGLKEQIAFARRCTPVDIIWFPQYNSPFFNVPAKRRITTIHDLMHFDLPNLYPWYIRSYLSFHLKNSLQRSDKCVTVSKYTQDAVYRKFGKLANKTCVIPNGCDSVRLTLKDENAPPPLNEKYILYVGNIKPHKNVAFAIKAFIETLSSEYKFIVVGKNEGFYNKEFNFDKEIQTLSGSVIFTGQVSDVELYNYYRHASLFVFPSLYEGFGLPLLEAMAFKIPIISSWATSLPEVGKDAIYYFDPTDQSSLRDLFIKFKNSEIYWDYDRYEDVLACYTWEKSIEAHIDAFLGK